MNSSTLIRKFKQVFADHGIPEELVSDNGPQFTSREFADFSNSYGF
jgi:transposase InsO family protein